MDEAAKEGKIYYHQDSVCLIDEPLLYLMQWYTVSVYTISTINCEVCIRDTWHMITFTASIYLHFAQGQIIAARHLDLHHASTLIAVHGLHSCGCIKCATQLWIHLHLHPIQPAWAAICSVPHLHLTDLLGCGQCELPPWVTRVGSMRAWVTRVLLVDLSIHCTGCCATPPFTALWSHTRK